MKTRQVQNKGFRAHDAFPIPYPIFEQLIKFIKCSLIIIKTRTNTYGDLMNCTSYTWQKGGHIVEPAEEQYLAMQRHPAPSGHLNLCPQSEQSQTQGSTSFSTHTAVSAGRVKGFHVNTEWKKTKNKTSRTQTAGVKIGYWA